MDTFKYINKVAVKNSLIAAIKDHEKTLEHLKKTLILLEAYDEKRHPRQQKLSAETKQTCSNRHEILGQYLQKTYPSLEDFDRHRLRQDNDNSFCVAIYHSTGQSITKGELYPLSRKYLMPSVEVVTDTNK